ncbi:hypothetical protein C7271_18975 [filamentous cyanobacterium CCP5]|nr:hypothetical protein C7271_18975 [filamentous cyanobacterium CCP5]
MFGPEGLALVDIPVALLAGSYDPATPAVFEQFLTFPWFTTPNRLLGLIEGQAHVDVTKLDGGLSQLIQSVPDLTLAAPDLINRYRNAITLAFFGRYVAGRADYQLYLRSSYAQYLNQDQSFKLLLISESSEEALLDSIRSRLGLPESPTATPITP